MNSIHTHGAIGASNPAYVHSLIVGTAEAIITRSDLPFEADEQQTIRDMIVRWIATETTSDIESFAERVVSDEFRPANAKKLLQKIIDEESSSDASGDDRRQSAPLAGSSSDAGGDGRRHPASPYIGQNQSLSYPEGEADQSSAEFEQVTPGDGGIDSISYSFVKGGKNIESIPASLGVTS